MIERPSLYMIERINESKTKLIIRCLIFLVCVFAFISPIVFDGASFLTRFVMYTGLSNSLLVIEYAILITFAFLKFDLNSKEIYIMRLVITSCIFLTFVVFGFILTPASLASGEYNPFTISSIFQHFITPPIAILEFILLDPNKEKKNKLLCLHSLDISIIYIVFIEIRGAINNYPHVRTGGVYSKYPYFLFDPYFMGYFFEGGELNVNFGVVPIIAVLIVINIFLGLILVVIKNKVHSRFI